jgi:peroxiredoxin
MTIATPFLWMSIGLFAVSPTMTAAGAHAEPAPPVRVQASERHAVRVGDEAPNFRLPDLDGKVTSLSQFRGKVVLLNFWATWCGPCRIEMPAMEQLYRAFSRREFQILAVSTDPQGVAVTRPFQQKAGLTFPILHDTDMQIGVTYGARSLPMTLMVDRQGVVRQKIFGARDWDSPEARELIQLLMKS